MAGLFTIQNEFRYEIVRKIFEGGMGVIYEAEQHGARDFVKRVAMKVIRQNYANQKQFIENFIGEAKLVADLIHTNIVQTYHLGEARGLYFICMELIHGVNLEQFAHQLAQKDRVLPVELAVFITSRVARGLAYAHAKTDDEGEVVAGKADYMSPEQADFQITDKRSDLFSTGVVLGNLLLGYNVFKGSNSEESRDRIMTMPLPNFCEMNPLIDPRLNEILHRTLARDLSQRYATADELLYDLEYYIYHKGYGPTNETLGKYMREAFGQTVPNAGDKGDTTIVDRPVQPPARLD